MTQTATLGKRLRNRTHDGECPESSSRRRSGERGGDEECRHGHGADDEGV